MFCGVDDLGRFMSCAFLTSSMLASHDQSLARDPRALIKHAGTRPLLFHSGLLCELFLALHGMAMAQLARLRSVAAVVPGQLVHLVWFFKHVIILWARVRFWQQGGKADERRGS